MIDELIVSHFKSFSEETIKLGPLNIIVGKNGSGKSNIIDAIDFLYDIASDDLDYAITKRHGADTVRQWSRLKPYHTTVGAKVSNSYGNGSYRITFSSSRNSYRVREEVFTWHGESPFSEDVYNSTVIRTSDGMITVESDFPEDDFDLDDMKLDSGEALLSRVRSLYTNLQDIIGYVGRELHAFSAFAIFPNTIRAPQSVSRSASLDSDGRNIASIIKQMSGDRRGDRDRLVRALRVVLPTLTGITVKSAAGYYVPIFNVTEPSGESHELNMAQVSDGTLRMLGILTALHQPRAPEKIALEEPEQMIHSALLGVIKDAVHNYLSQNKARQVFLTTHSPALIDMFEAKDVVAVEFVDGVTKAGRVSKRQMALIKEHLVSLGDLVMAEDLEID